MKLCVHSKYYSPSGQAVFVICFRLAFESHMKQSSSTMKYFISGFQQSFVLPLVKRLHTFDIAKPFLFSFYFHFHSFVISFYKQTFDSETTFTKHCNRLECFMFFPNDHIRGLTAVAIMVSSLWTSRFYTVLIIQFPRSLLSLLFFIHFPKF